MPSYAAAYMRMNILSMSIEETCFYFMCKANMFCPALTQHNSLIRAHSTARSVN